MTENLTDRQREIYQFIVRFQADERYSPSLTDIATFMKTPNKNAAHKVVFKLVQNGLIELSPKGIIRFPHGTLVPQAKAV